MWPSISTVLRPPRQFSVETHTHAQTSACETSEHWWAASSRRVSVLAERIAGEAETAEALERLRPRGGIAITVPLELLSTSKLAEPHLQKLVLAVARKLRGTASRPGLARGPGSHGWRLTLALSVEQGRRKIDVRELASRGEQNGATVTSRSEQDQPSKTAGRIRLTQHLPGQQPTEIDVPFGNVAIDRVSTPRSVEQPDSAGSTPPLQASIWGAIAAQSASPAVRSDGPRPVLLGQEVLDGPARFVVRRIEV